MNTYAIVVTYNPDLGLLKRQYSSLSTQVDKIIYVDNGTSVDIASILQFDNVLFIKNDCNLGLSKAQNIGIEAIHAKNTDFIILFDQDSVPPKKYVSTLISCYEDCSKIANVALVGPAIRNLTKSSIENNRGIVIHGIFLKKVTIKKSTPVSFCIASGSLIPIKVLDEVGLMEEKLFIDGIDIEWCLRARYKGYQIVQTNSTYLDHCLGDGRDKRVESHSPLREYYIMRNSIWMIRQTHIPWGYRIRKVFTAIGRLCLSFKSLNMEYVKSDLRGVKDGLKL